MMVPTKEHRITEDILKKAIASAEKFHENDVSITEFKVSFKRTYVSNLTCFTS